METSSLNSEEMELQQMQLDERELHKKCLALFEKLKKHLGFIHRRLLLRYLEELEKVINERVLKYGAIRIKEKEVQAIKEIENRLIQQQESLITEGAAIEACLVTEGASLEACLVNEGITVNDNMGFMKCSRTELENNSSVTPFSRSEDENRSSDKDSSSLVNECSSLGIDADADIRSSNDSNTLLGANENYSNIIFDILDMDPNRDKEHDAFDYEKQRAFFASLINNLKCNVEKCNEVNREAQQANALLTNELERYKKKEKHFAKDMIIESEYYKKINLLNYEISYLRSQACEKDKTFAKENKKFDEYVQPLLNRKNELENKNQEFLKKINDLDNKLQKARQTDQTLRMLLPKEDNVNTGTHGLGFENQNDYVNPSLLNKAKELAPCF
uniref:Reverse transcriptase zinc-binding domain-containing protein n=1 Tax=Tanacetum cinerariifolium TaxID=118510 RepID=A0A6L2KMV7_TANCI|nr:reverse transcriptase zinc-binding domain-containing protein [Tanacetum cinerariifolium]